jgi:hypothetical protein
MHLLIFTVMFGYGRRETSDARPAQPLDVLSYILTSAPADQHAPFFFFLSRAF